MSKKSKLIVAAAITVLSLSSQAFARGGTFHLNPSEYEQAMAVFSAPPPVINNPAR